MIVSQTEIQRPPRGRDVPSHARTKTTAILEVMGVYVVGQTLGMVLFAVMGRLMNIPLKNPLLGITASISQGDLLRVTWQLLVLLLCQSAGWLLLAFGVGWWRRRYRPSHYGLTLAGRSPGFYLKTGLVVFVVAELLGKLLSLANAIHPMGEQIAWREAVFNMSWTTPAFWAFMAVGSFVLVPILEELFFRGYIQTRLEEGFGAPVAILATAFLFQLSHSQYLILNPFNVGMILTGLFGSVVWGYAFYLTRSLWVTIVAHALVNIPIRGVGLWVEILGMLVVVVVARRDIGRAAVDFWSMVRSISPCWQALCVVASCGLFSIAFAMLGDVMILAGSATFIVAMILVWLEKRRSASPVPAIRGADC